MCRYERLQSPMEPGSLLWGAKRSAFWPTGFQRLANSSVLEDLGNNGLAYPITSLPGGLLDVPVSAIAERFGVSMDQVLLAWAKAKGAIVVTTSSKKERLLGYLNAGDLTLTEDEMASIDAAGAKGPPLSPVKRFLRQLVGIALVSTIAGAASGHLRFW
ncbi:hypothetical protein C8R44DRAFT_737479 [Mycena epipterygia]|nr:hypothetical protein C8R44DRAFT_737479 [Mycena epipterygia]